MGGSQVRAGQDVGVGVGVSVSVEVYGDSVKETIKLEECSRRATSRRQMSEHFQQAVGIVSKPMVTIA